MLYDIASENEMAILEMEVDKDHVRLPVQYWLTRSIVDVVRSFKQISTFRLWRTPECLPLLKMNFWKERTFWTDVYFAASLGNVGRATIENYIRKQG